MGFVETRRMDNEKGRYTLVFLAAPGDVEQARKDQAPLVELTYNWDPEAYTGGRNFGHLAYRVDDIYATCAKLKAAGVTINRRRATAIWPSSARPTTSRSSSSRRAARCPRQSPGPRWRTPACGEAGLAARSGDRRADEVSE